MGLFGGGGKGGGGLFGNVDWSRIGSGLGAAQAFLSGDHGQAASILRDRQRQRAEQLRAQAEAEKEAQLRFQAAQALEAQGHDKSVIAGMRPEGMSAERPEIGPGGAMPPAQAPQAAPQRGATNQARLRAQASWAIRRGADPARIKQRLRQMLGEDADVVHGFPGFPS